MALAVRLEMVRQAAALYLAAMALAMTVLMGQALRQGQGQAAGPVVMAATAAMEQQAALAG